MKREMERKEQEKKKSQKVEYISGGTQPGTVVPTPKVNIPIPGRELRAILMQWLIFFPIVFLPYFVKVFILGWIVYKTTGFLNFLVGLLFSLQVYQLWLVVGCILVQLLLTLQLEMVGKIRSQSGIRFCSLICILNII